MATVLTNEVEGVSEPHGQVGTVIVLHRNDFVAEVLREVVATASGHIKDGGNEQFLEVLLHAGMAGVPDEQVW